MRSTRTRQPSSSARSKASKTAPGTFSIESSKASGSPSQEARQGPFNSDTRESHESRYRMLKLPGHGLGLPKVSSCGAAPRRCGLEKTALWLGWVAADDGGAAVDAAVS
jgi:hypothetical protein